MRRREDLGLALLLLLALPAGAQDSRREFRPELNVYVNQGSRTRLIFKESFNEDRGEGRLQGQFAFFAEIALRPVFRRELRQSEDVFRRRYLTVRAGYQYNTMLSSGAPSSEHRPILEVTGRYPLPGAFVLIDRNRVDFRYMSGTGYSTRYRNRLWLERDLRFGKLVATPYIYEEVYFDGRYHAWTQSRTAVGTQFPAGPHLVIEPYGLRRRSSRSSVSLTWALGLKFNFYF